MKYTKLQQKKANKMQQDINLVNAKLEYQRQIINNANLKIEELYKERYKEQTRMDKINKNIKKKCKHVAGIHKGGVIYRDFGPNFRYIFCDDCDEDIGREDV